MSRKKKTDIIDKLSTEFTNNTNTGISSRDNIIKICNAEGLTIEHLVKTIYDGTRAMKMTVDKYGEEHLEPDIAMRLKAASIGLELRDEIGLVNDNSINTNIIAVINNLDSEAKKRLDEYRAEFSVK